MAFKSSLFSIITSIIILCSACSRTTENLYSPDKKLRIEFLSEGIRNKFSYSVYYKGCRIIEPSRMGFRFGNSPGLKNRLKIRSTERKKNNQYWKPVYGEQNEYPDVYNELVINLESQRTNKVELKIILRAYNEGVAFHYVFINSKGTEIKDELTEFSLPGNPTAWISSSAQGQIYKRKLSTITGPCERPLLAELSDSLYIAIGEAALVDFSRMKLIRKRTKPNVLEADLKPIESNSNIKAIVPATDYKTPWRFIMAGRTPSEILQNNFLILNLNEENKIGNTNWIKPGKVIREVTLSTQGGINCIDFAKEHNLQFIEFDAGWYGDEYKDTSNATTISTTRDLKLDKIVSYAKKNNIGVILYVNQHAMEKQLDEILPLYKSWGISGVKYGFVKVGSQYWTSWLHGAVRKAADHELMIDIHDEYRPTGYSRTYPNLMTQEGVRGDEEKVTNETVINTIFTRMIVGAADQTNCYFNNRVTDTMGSHVSQMAKTICIYSPWQFLYWYDRPNGNILEIDDLSFYDQVPTIWDATKIIDGYPGEFAIIARRKSKKWYLGALTGNDKRLINIKFDFLDRGVKYRARVFSDDKSLNTKTNVKIDELIVTDDYIFKHKMFALNGLAIIFTPLNNN